MNYRAAKIGGAVMKGLRGFCQTGHVAHVVDQ